MPPRTGTLAALERADWAGSKDGERAVAVSTRALRDVVGGLDPVRYFSLIEAAVEAQLHGPGGDASRIIQALQTAQPAFLRAEELAAAEGGDPAVPARVFWRSQPQFLLAQALHALPDTGRRALSTAYANLRFLVDIAEAAAGRDDGSPGYAALQDLIRSRTPPPLVEHTVAALSILMAIMQKTKLQEPSRHRLVDDCRGLVAAYVLDSNGDPEQDLVVYPKATHGLAARGLELFGEHGQPEDNELLVALHELSARTRPTDIATQVAQCLQDMKWARHVGDCAAANCYR